MRKPLAYGKKGLSGDLNVIITIVPESTTTSQEFLEVSKYIEHRQLTKAIDALQKHGIAGDLAVFIIANLQLAGGEA